MRGRHVVLHILGAHQARHLEPESATGDRLQVVPPARSVHDHQRAGRRGLDLADGRPEVAGPVGVAVLPLVGHVVVDPAIVDDDPTLTGQPQGTERDDPWRECPRHAGRGLDRGGQREVRQGGGATELVAVDGSVGEEERGTGLQLRRADHMVHRPVLGSLGGHGRALPPEQLGVDGGLGAGRPLAEQLPREPTGHDADDDTHDADHPPVHDQPDQTHQEADDGEDAHRDEAAQVAARRRGPAEQDASIRDPAQRRRDMGRERGGLGDAEVRAGHHDPVGDRSARDRADRNGAPVESGVRQRQQRAEPEHRGSMATS